MQESILRQLSNGMTPAYVLDVDALQKKASHVKEQLQKGAQANLCYAMKANPFLIRSLDGIADKFEVCSPGELSICRQAGIAMDKIVLSGVNKGYEDTLVAMQSGVELFTAESWKHLELIQRCAQEVGRCVKVLLRLSSGNQFGVDRKTIQDMMAKREQYANVEMVGIHYYSGTQKRTSKIRAEIQELISFVQELETDYSMTLEALEYGPGLPIEYFTSKQDEEVLLQECVDALAAVDTHIKVTVELGRFLTADCGSYVTKVVDVKHTEDKTYAIVDGGIHHVNYYGQVMGARIPPVRFYPLTDGKYIESSENVEASEMVCVCGSLCTVADVLIGSFACEHIKEEDIFVFEKIGAYSVTEGIYLFLSRCLPKVYFLEKGQLKLIRDAYETYEWNCER